MNTTPDDVLLTGLAKDPESVGRIVAQAINQAETRIVAAKAPEAESEPEAKAKPKPEAELKLEAKSKRPSDSTPQDRQVNR